MDVRTSTLIRHEDDDGTDEGLDHDVLSCEEVSCLVFEVLGDEVHDHTEGDDGEDFPVGSDPFGDAGKVEVVSNL